MLLIALVALFGCKGSVEVKVDNLPIVEKAINDTASRFYADFRNYPADVRMLPIGVFDSGTGGLTVLEKLLSLDSFDNITGEFKSDEISDFAGEHFIYLADQANMPYGTYDAVGKADYLRELVVKDALFLMGDKYYYDKNEAVPAAAKPRVKIMVIACNTATAYGLSHIESLLEQSGTPVKVIGVINAGSKATLDRIDFSGDAPASIGVLATQGTIASGAYERTLNELIRDKGIKAQVNIVNQSGYGFAESVDSEPDFVDPSLSFPRDTYRGPRVGEGDECLQDSLMKVYNFDYSEERVLFNLDAKGVRTDIQLNNAINYARFNLVSLVEKLRRSGSKAPLKAVILGCTHYPFLIETLQQVIEELKAYNVDNVYPYRDLISDDMVFIDPALYTAIECYNTLRQDGNLALRTTDTEVSAYISVAAPELASECLTPDGKLTYDFKYGRETGGEDVTTKQVPFSHDNIDANNLQRIERLLPYSFSLIAPTLR